mmetsp:Transcript_49834/g.113432  ORF Transcript_49834/g.113432 Transcript_49834/m.113432 type:complete len:294 (-) Transcript_49834:161-1042(-)
MAQRGSCGRGRRTPPPAVPSKRRGGIPTPRLLLQPPAQRERVPLLSGLPVAFWSLHYGAAVTSWPSPCAVKANKLPHPRSPAPPPPPPPPPPPAKVPPGLRLDFDDHLGNIKTIYATYRPLGIINRESAPINVDDLTFNSYAMSLGVRETWTIVHVGNVDVRGKTNYAEVKGLIDNGLKSYPVWPLKMELTQAGTGAKKNYEFNCRPLGFEFDNKAPIKVKQVYPNSQAQEKGMKGAKDNETWVVSNLNNIDLPIEEHDFQKVFGMLKDGTRALDPYSTNDGSRSVDQLKGWD